jgi:hypothetical protein
VLNSHGWAALRTISSLYRGLVITLFLRKKFATTSIFSISAFVLQDFEAFFESIADNFIRTIIIFIELLYSMLVTMSVIVLRYRFDMPISLSRKTGYFFISLSESRINFSRHASTHRLREFRYLKARFGWWSLLGSIVFGYISHIGYICIREGIGVAQYSHDLMENSFWRVHSMWFQNCAAFPIPW